nr:DUF305 domain-containing protein [Solimonas marina]
MVAGIALATAYRLGERAAAVRVQSPGPVDIGFAQFMRSHHDQAVVMTQIMLARGNTQLTGLLRAIQTAQLIEIGEMKGWLLLWQRPLLPATTSMDWMLLGKTAPDAALSRYLSDCRASPGGMPGLASAAQLDELRRLDGAARDRLFLQLMIRHHQGGLPMAHFAARNAETVAVRTLAADIEAHQAQELAWMTLLTQRLSH